MWNSPESLFGPDTPQENLLFVEQAGKPVLLQEVGNLKQERFRLRISTDLFDILSEIVAQAAEFGFGGHAHAIVPNRNQHFRSKRSWPDIRVAENF